MNKWMNLFLWIRANVFVHLPYGLVLKVGKVLGWLLYHGLKSRRQVAESNIKKALQLGSDEARKLARSCFTHLGLTTAEILLIPRVTKKFVHRHVEIEGIEHLEQALAEGKGVVVFTGHFGNWELMGAVVASLGYPVDAVARKQNSSGADEFMAEVRRQYGLRIHERGFSLRAAFRALKQGRMLALLADQDARGRGWFVDFFNQPSSTFSGPVQLAQRSAAPIVPAFFVRTGRPGYRLVFCPPRQVAPDASIEEMQNQLQELTTTLEDTIRQYPEQWFWIHRRWKTKPLSAEESRET